jgi:hypothetical protein
MSPRVDACGIIYDLYVRGDERYVNGALSNDRLFVLQTEGTFQILPTYAAETFMKTSQRYVRPFFGERRTTDPWTSAVADAQNGGGSKSRLRKWRAPYRLRAQSGGAAISGKTCEIAQFAVSENKIG